MFDATKATQLPATAFAYVEAPKGGTCFAVQNLAKNGNIDPAYLMLAYAFDQGWTTATVHTNYEMAGKWRTAAQGLRHLAATLPGGFSTKLSEMTAQKQVSGNLTEVTLIGGTPPEGPLPLDTGDIFTPNANGFHNIPRLYLMAALVLEEMRSAAVAALVANAGGLVVALGTKAHGEGGCGHAEVRALFSIKGLVPDRSVLFSTLKPCTMCAGLIQALFSGNCKQYWARGDPSAGADYRNVLDLALPNGLASYESQKDSAHVRQIKLKDGKSFTDAFLASWTGRDARLQDAKEGSSERMKEAFKNWCDAVIRPRNVVGRTNAVSIRVKEGDGGDLLAKAKGCGDATALSRRSDIFERIQSGTAKAAGLKNEDWPLIVNAFKASSFAAEVDKPIKTAQKETEMGIVEYISGSAGSKSLRVAARNALSRKFVKYGKSVDEVKGVTGANLPAPTGAAAPSKSNDDRMPKIANYLFDFLKTQR